MELTKTDNRGNEGANISITVRLEGLITSSVTVEIELLTLSQFLTKPEAPLEYTLSHDPAERKWAKWLQYFNGDILCLPWAADDFSHDNPLIHTFSPVVSATRQTVDFTIDIVDDTINEKVEQFVVRIVGATTEGTDAYYPEQSDALFATVTILIDPKAPDSQFLSLSLSLIHPPYLSVCLSLPLLAISSHINYPPLSSFQRQNCGWQHHPMAQ